MDSVSLPLFNTDAVLAVRSPGLGRRLNHINRFVNLGESRLKWTPPFFFPNSKKVAGIAGWGLRGVGSEVAEEKGLPYVALEDGFLRSFGVGPRETNGHSIVIDPVGIYYDATRPSLLENLIQQSDDIAPVLLDQARELMDLMTTYNLGKYNNSPDLPEEAVLTDGRPLVVVVDQIAGDYSIAYGGASEALFREMLDTAIAENPGAKVVLRGHPCEGHGGRKGNLTQYARELGIEILAQDFSWMSLAKRADHVYVVTSNAGLEALMAGAKVTCFGKSFYSGWGLTEDRQKIARRTARPTLEALVAAVYLQYCRYLHPVTGRRTSAVDVARYLAEKRMEAFGGGESVTARKQRWAGDRA